MRAATPGAVLLAFSIFGMLVASAPGGTNLGEREVYWGLVILAVVGCVMATIGAMSDRWGK